MIRLFVVAALLAACSAAPGATTTPTSVATLAPVVTSVPATATAAPVATPPQSVITPPAGFGIVIGTATSANGVTYLVPPDNFSLYVFDNDSPGQSACTGNCAGTWPPLPGGPQYGGGAGVGGTFGSITRDDGTVQVTYNDMPLYFYSGDAAAGDTNGDGIGGVWHLATP